MTVPWSIIEFIVRQILPDPPIMLPCAKKFSPLGTRAILKSPPFFPGGGDYDLHKFVEFRGFVVVF